MEREPFDISVFLIFFGVGDIYYVRSALLFLHSCKNQNDLLLLEESGVFKWKSTVLKLVYITLFYILLYLYFYKLLLLSTEGKVDRQQTKKLTYIG